MNARGLLQPGAIALGLASAVAPPAFAAQPTYLAVIDAGSSGTRLTLYADDATTLVPREVTSAAKKTAIVALKVAGGRRIGST